LLLSLLHPLEVATIAKPPDSNATTKSFRRYLISNVSFLGDLLAADWLQ